MIVCNPLRELRWALPGLIVVIAAVGIKAYRNAKRLNRTQVDPRWECVLPTGDEVHRESP